MSEILDLLLPKRKKQISAAEERLLSGKGREQISFAIYDDLDIFKSTGSKSGDVSSIQKIITELRKTQGDRKERYKELREAGKDPIIGQAIEMMADDATQFDVDRERTIWVEGENKEYVKALNYIINKYIEPFIDTTASNIVKLGEFAFKTEQKEFESVDFGVYRTEVVLIPVKDVELVNHLILPDYEHAFVVADDIKTIGKNSVGDVFLEADKFLHFLNYSVDNSLEIELMVKKEGQKAEKKKVFVLQGESILNEKILEVWRILRVLENGIIAARLAKSKLVRFVNVDVSRLTDDTKAQNIVNYIHGAIVENQNISQDYFEASTIQAEPVVVTVPVSNGVGKITVEEFASDVNIRDIADLDYFLNKLFAGLRTPKQYFNFEDGLPGLGISGASLMRIDIRYARAVKKIQRVLIEGVKQLIRIFNKYNGIEDRAAPKVTVHIVKVASAEDGERYMEMSDRITLADVVINAVYDPEFGVDKKKAEMLANFFEDVVPLAELSTYYKNLMKGVSIKKKPADVQLKEE